MGVKVMHKNREQFLDNKHPYRLCQDSLSSILPYINKRQIQCSAADMLFMIQNMNILLADLPSEDLKQKIKEGGKGCFILYAENDGPIKDRESLSCLCHGNSVTVMVSAELCESLKLRYLDVVEK